jgi:possible alpha-L-fucosidase
MYALTDMRKENFVDKRYWEKSCKYSIRKLSVGAASVLLGAVFLAVQGVAADGVELKETDATITESSAKPDTKVEEVLASNTKTQPIAESAEKQTNLEPEPPQTASQSETSATTAPADNKESEKPELPVNKQEHYELHYNQPTAPSYDGWEKQALPVGNGEMGAKVFGLIGEERIQYNEKTLWSGGPQPDSQDYNGGNYKDRYKVLAEIRKALEDGDRQKAKRLAERNLVGPNNAQYGRYLAFGDIFMVFNNQKKGLENVTDYHRGLDISEAITTTSYTQDGTSFKRETFSSFPDDVTVTHLSKKGDKNLDFTLWNSLTEDLIANGQYSRDNSNYKKGTISVDSNGILLKGTVKDNGLKFASYLGIKTDGQVTAQDGYLTVKGASYATLLLSAKTNFAQNPKTNYRKDIDVEKTVKSIVEAAKAKDYETLKNDHIKDYQSLFNRVQLNLGGSKSNQTTKEALQTYNPTKGQKLEELFFQYGRYLLISSSRNRTDALPANLQGVWNAVDNPPWNSDYHLNVNLQMNYWPAYMSNLAETAKPMINYIDDMRYYGRIAAKEYAGIESKEGQENGWLVHTQATPFGWTTPGWNYYWGWSPAANAWMMQNVYDHYKFTKDETYLKEKIYPMLKETAKFWNSFLHYDKASDRWVSSPSYSPEHGTITIGNTFDQSLVWQLFHDYMEAANHLKVDQDLVAEVKDKFDKLKPLHINQDGRIKEWYEEDSPQFTNEGIENHHRHVSHLVGLFPGTLFGKDQPEYLEAARATLNHRGDGGTGWSKANKINLWARLLDGNRAHRLLAEQLRSSTLENLWDTHAPFQIDGNFGATSGMAEMLLQSHTGYIAPLPALPDAWKDGQVSGLVARGNFEVSMKWKEKNLETLSFLSNVGGDLVVDYPNIEASIIKINGKEVQASRLKDNRIQLATQKGDVITFENFPGLVTRLSALRKDSITAELDFNTVEGASHYVIRRESKDENSQTPSVREFITNQTHFIDRSIDSSHAYTYTVKAMLRDRTTPVSDPASIDSFSELMDDRDKRIQYGSAFGNWSDTELFGGTEKYADISNGNYSDKDATATIPFSGTGIRIYGLKTASLGKALVTLDGKEMPALDFYTSGATEKGALIGEFTNLADGDHVLTLKVDPNSPQGRKKISLDSFNILKAPSVSLDNPSLDPIKSKDKTVTLTLPTGNWDAVAVTFPGIKDPLLLRKVDDDHLVTSGEQTVLTIKNNKVQLDIPETTDRKAGKPIEAYAIQGTTTTSPVVAVFPKDETAPVEEKILTSKGDEPAPVGTIPEYTDPIGTAGDQEAPSVVIPEYTEPIGTAGNQEAPSVERPEYTGPIGTAGEQEAPSVEIPEYTEPIGTAGDQEAPTVERPEYTGPIGTVGDQEAPSVERPEYTKSIETGREQKAPTIDSPNYSEPGKGARQEKTSTSSIAEYKLRVLKDEKTGVEIIGRATDLEGISHLSSKHVLAQELFGKIYDAYDIQFKNSNNHNIQPRGAVLVRLPITADVENIYYLTPTKELKSLSFTIRDGMAEFTTSLFSTYAVVYQNVNTPETSISKTVATTSLNFEQASTTDSPSQLENTHLKEQLPETGESSNPLLFLSGLSLVLTSIFLLKNKMD